MTVNSTNSIASTTTGADTTSTTDAKREALGKDAFLQLLVTQLQHQDPTQAAGRTASSSRSSRIQLAREADADRHQHRCSECPARQD